MKKILTLFFVLLFFWISYIYSEDSLWFEESIFQDAIDKNFKEIDEQMLLYLINLDTQKDYCFGPHKKKDYTECIDEITKKFSYTWEFGQKYNEACQKSLKEVLKEKKSLKAKKVSQILSQNISWNCTSLYNTKLDIYKQVAFRILKKNKLAILKDEYKNYTKDNRWKYNNVYELMRINRWYTEKFWQRWPDKTAK